MDVSHSVFPLLALLAGLALPAAAAEPASGPAVEPRGTQASWVPTPVVLVEKMLDMAEVTPQDYVIDLGSGDGRCVIAAARRGARSLGVEYDPKLVDWSRRAAESAGVADKATFVLGDMYEADISRATVLALFLLPENLDALTDKFLALKPGARIVANSFQIEGWDADESATVGGDCGSWCTAHLYIVPAKVAGTWRLPNGLLTLRQRFQMLSGTLWSGGTKTPITQGRLRGDRIKFTAGGVQYSGRVAGDVIREAKGAWTATRMSGASR